MRNGENAESSDYSKHNPRVGKLQKKLAHPVRCLNYDTEHDQDENAAKNIEQSHQ